MSSRIVLFILRCNKRRNAEIEYWISLLLQIDAFQRYFCFCNLNALVPVEKPYSKHFGPGPSVKLDLGVITNPNCTKVTKKHFMTSQKKEK